MAKKAKYFLLAPIKVEILMSRGSAYKIVTESGTMSPKVPNVSALRKKTVIELGFKNIFLQ